MTIQRDHESVLMRSELATAVLDSLPDATAVLDEYGVIAAVNRAWRMFTLDNGGDPSTTGVGTDYLGVCERAAARGCNDAATVAAGIHAVLDGETVQSELEYPCPSPAAGRWFLLRITRLTGPLPGVVISHVNITRRKSAEEAVAHQAAHDPLTGLGNRRLFASRLEAALVEDRGRGHLGVWFIDLDGFKAVNDTHGHHAGDEVLQTAAHRIRSRIGPRYSAARLGGDEFAVLARLPTLDALCEMGGRLTAALAEPQLVHGRLLSVPGSVGVTTASSGESASDVMRRADQAMYAVKRSRQRRVG